MLRFDRFAQRTLRAGLDEVDAGDRDLFVRQMVCDNLQRARALAWLSAALVGSMAVFEWALGPPVHAGVAALISTLLWPIRLAWLTGAGLFLVFVRPPADPGRVTRRHSAAALAFVLVGLGLAAWRCGLAQPVLPSCAPWQIGLFAFVIFFRFDVRRTLVALLPPAVLLIVLVPLNQPVRHLAISTVVAAVVTLVLALIGARMAFVSAARDFVRRRLVERSNIELEQLSTIDALTGIGNRRAFDAALPVEWRRAGREDAALALLMVDVDHFKRFNDEHGHVAGDRALAVVALLLRSASRRPADIATRYGGEEFAVLLPSTGVEGALSVAETLRLGIESAELIGLPAGSLTVSIGVAVARPLDGGVPAELVKRADAALYAAKDAGRNRVEIAPSTDAPAAVP